MTTTIYVQHVRSRSRVVAEVVTAVTAAAEVPNPFANLIRSTASSNALSP